MDTNVYDPRTSKFNPKVLAGYLVLGANPFRDWLYNGLSANSFTFFGYQEDALVSERIKRALEKATPSENCALLLSGGLDSSLLYKINQNITPFCCSWEIFPEDYQKDQYSSRGDDIRYARRLAGNRLIEVDITKDFWGIHKVAIDLLDEPSVTMSLPALYLAFQEVKKRGFSTVLLGEGADELFGGYDYLHREHYSHLSLDESWDKYLEISSFFSPTELERYFCPDLTKAFSKVEVEIKPNVNNIQDLVQLVDIRHRGINNYVARAQSLADNFGLKLVCPYLDAEVVELAKQLPPEQREDKKILRVLARDISVPKEIIERTKTRFIPPVEVLGERVAIKRNILGGILAQTGILKHDNLDELLNQSTSVRNHSSKLWSLYTLEVWISGGYNVR